MAGQDGAQMRDRACQLKLQASAAAGPGLEFRLQLLLVGKAATLKGFQASSEVMRALRLQLLVRTRFGVQNESRPQLCLVRLQGFQASLEVMRALRLQVSFSSWNISPVSESSTLYLSSVI
ncbi:hypothetical protein EJB05_13380, partial [Eragrostis curvula]